MPAESSPERRRQTRALIAPVGSLNDADFERIRENMGGATAPVGGGDFIMKFPRDSRLIRENGELYTFDYGARSLLPNTSVAVCQKGYLAFVEANRVKRADGSYVESTYVILVDGNGEKRQIFPAGEEKDKNIERARAISKRLADQIAKRRLKHSA